MVNPTLTVPTSVAVCLICQGPLKAQVLESRADGEILEAAIYCALVEWEDTNHLMEATPEAWYDVLEQATNWVKTQRVK